MSKVEDNQVPRGHFMPELSQWGLLYPSTTIFYLGRQYYLEYITGLGQDHPMTSAMSVMEVVINVVKSTSFRAGFYHAFTVCL